jgi:two-component system sensor histidine kinase PilS (NtrC family)
MPNNDNAIDAQDLTRRIVGLVNIYRLLAAAVLLLVHLVMQPNPTVGAALPRLFVQICVSYFSIGALMAVLGVAYFHSRRLLVLTYTLIDTAAFSGLLYASGGVESNLAVMMVLPVGGMVLLADGRDPPFVAAIATVGLLLQQLLAQWANLAPQSDFSLAGISGAVIFAVALSVWPIANRLRESEALVKRQEVDLANLAELSQYIVRHLRESILVVDTSDRIRLINESAAKVLGERAAIPGALLGEVSAPLLYRLSTWRSARGKSEQSDSPGPLTSSDGSALIKAHFAPLGSVEPAPVLIFLEDTAVLTAKVQQTKLAALGRLSASIAHEIRNPVGAMTHAAQLLEESLAVQDSERRLVEIMRNNGKRVSNIIDNVLGLSRRATPAPESLQLADWCQRFRDEFCATMQTAPQRLGVVASVNDLEVRMDAGHLHQIMWNLCENALYHAGESAAGGEIEIRFGRLSNGLRPYLEVADRGPGISAADADRIFEPFFTRRPGGTGLGLFLSRELAEINDGTLLYAARDGGGSVFRLVLSDPSRWGTGHDFGESHRA